MSEFPADFPTGPGCSAPGSIFGSENPSREDIARLLLADPEKIRRRLRGKLRQLERARRGQSLVLLELDDLLSTVVRRVNRAVLSGRLRTEHEAEFWAYVYTVAENLIVERLRRKGEPIFVADPGAAWNTTSTDAGSGPQSAEWERVEAMERVLAAAPTASDRELIIMKARGASYASIAAATGRSQDAIRTQWSKLCRVLRERLPPRE